MTHSPQAGAGEPHQGRPAPGQQPWTPPAPGQQAWGQPGTEQQGWTPQAAPQQGWGHSGFPVHPQPLPPQGRAGLPQPVLPMPYKDSTAAWLLWFFLGSFGAHHFYLGRTKWGVAYAVGFVMSWLFTIVLIGFLGLITLFVLWIIDATQMSQRLQQWNAHAYTVNRSLGLA